MSSEYVGTLWCYMTGEVVAAASDYEIVQDLVEEAMKIFVAQPRVMVPEARIFHISGGAVLRVLKGIEGTAGTIDWDYEWDWTDKGAGPMA